MKLWNSATGTGGVRCPLVWRRSLDRRQEKRLAQETATQLTVKAPSISTRVMNLSGGNQQKVILARWLARTPGF